MRFADIAPESEALSCPCQTLAASLFSTLGASTQDPKQMLEPFPDLVRFCSSFGHTLVALVNNSGSHGARGAPTNGVLDTGQGL